MPVFYELRGKSAVFGDLAINLYSGCAVGCRYCIDAAVRHMTLEQWTTGPRRAGIFCRDSPHNAKKMVGDPREILLGPAADPYQSDEAARLTRKASHHGAIPPVRAGGHAVRHAEHADFDILAPIAGGMGRKFSFAPKRCARSGSPAMHQSPNGYRRSAQPMRQESRRGSKSTPQLIRPS